LLALLPLPSLRGPHVLDLLGYFTLASAAYFIAVYRLDRDRIPVAMIWGFAMLFRILLLFSTPSLSDDIYRYIWDGHLFARGINPYAYPVNSPLLDGIEIHMRALVNHNWMASPYLPVAQLLFGTGPASFPPVCEPSKLRLPSWIWQPPGWSWIF